MPLVKFVVRNSERVDWTRCRQRHWWAYHDLLKPKEVAPALRFGDLIHVSLAAWYKPSRTRPLRGPKPWLTFDKVYKQQLVDHHRKFKIRLEDEEEWVDAYDLGMEMLHNYIDQYGKDERYVIIAPEQAIQVDLYDEEGNYICTFVGQLDAIVKDLETMKIGLLEHKTAATIRTDHLNMDEQNGTYWAVAPFWLEAKGILKPGEELDFILYNFLRKAGKDTRPRNAEGAYLNKPSKDALLAALGLDRAPKGVLVPDLEEMLRAKGQDPALLGEVSKVQPAPLFERERVYRSQNDRIATLHRIRDQVAEMKMVADGTLPHYKTILGGCVGMFGCPYRAMCEVHEINGDWEAVRDATMTTWDPYAAHELEREKDR